MKKKKKPPIGEKPIMLTPRKYAEEQAVAYTTVMFWLRNDLLPGVEKHEVADKTYYTIPKGTPRPAIKAGRPPKEKSEDESDD